MKSGDLVYRVRWKDGVPFIQHGRLVEIGAKKKSLRVQFSGEKSLSKLNEASSDMTAAIEMDLKIVYALGCNLCATIWKKRKSKPMNPWDVALNVAELTRLYRKLRKHHLAPKREL